MPAGSWMIVRPGSPTWLACMTAARSAHRLALVRHWPSPVSASTWSRRVSTANTTSTCAAGMARAIPLDSTMAGMNLEAIRFSTAALLSMRRTSLESVDEDHVDDRSVLECADIAAHARDSWRFALVGRQGRAVHVDAALARRAVDRFAVLQQRVGWRGSAVVLQRPDRYQRHLAHGITAVPADHATERDRSRVHVRAVRLDRAGAIVERIARVDGVVRDDRVRDDEARAVVAGG